MDIIKVACSRDHKVKYPEAESPGEDKGDLELCRVRTVKEQNKNRKNKCKD